MNKCETVTEQMGHPMITRSGDALDAYSKSTFNPDSRLRPFGGAYRRHRIYDVVLHRDLSALEEC